MCVCVGGGGVGVGWGVTLPGLHAQNTCPHTPVHQQIHEALCEQKGKRDRDNSRAQRRGMGGQRAGGGGGGGWGIGRLGWVQAGVCLNIGLGAW